MKDFIEVTRKNGLKRLVNINKIHMVVENIIYMDDDTAFLRARWSYLQKQWKEFNRGV